MAIVGPGAAQEQELDIKPLLEGASEYEYVTILNPLTDDFAVRVAQDIPVNVPYTAKTQEGTIIDEGQLGSVFGASLRNKDFKGRRHVFMDTIIEAGKTIILKGSEAQVAVRQLVNEILQREGHSRLMADPTLRKQVEERIIQSRGPIQDLMDRSIQTPRNQIDEAISRSNEARDEEAFPELRQEAGGAATEVANTSSGSQEQRRPVGRPKKANS